MPDAFIYDHVRTPRGRGKADGALHEVTALNLAAQTLAALKARNELDTAHGRRRGARLRRSGRRGRRRHRARRGDRRRLRQRGAGRADQPLLRLGPRCGEFRRRAGDVRAARHGGRRRRRIDEPRRHRRLGRRLAGRSLDRAQILFHAAGHLRRPDRDQIRLLARAMRRVRGREPEAHGGGVAGRPFRALGGAGEGPERAHHPGARRASAARHQHAVAGRAQAVVRADGRARRLRRGRGAGASRGRVRQARAPCRQFLGHRRRRRRGADRQPRGRPRGEAQAARARSGRSPISAPTRR